MNEQSHSASPRPEQPQTGRRPRRWLFVTTIALAAALTGAVASRAISQNYWHGPGFWHGPAFMGGAFDPARVEDGADRMVRHVAIEIDATPEQQEKLRAIVKGAVKDLLPMRDRAQAARQRGRMLLTQPSIDRAAIESLRAEQIALADTASKRLAQALGDAADVLTLDQRRKIDERLTELRERRGFWHGWRRG
jgi:periplasmic protein CpxP/Spy